MAPVNVKLLKSPILGESEIMKKNVFERSGYKMK